MFDFHMHSTVSFDGHDAPEQMIAAAKKAGLKEICFTDHVDYIKNSDDHSMAFDSDAYHRAYDALQSEDLLIRRGMEFGLYPDNGAALRQRLVGEKYDFILGSVHFVDEFDVYFKEYWDGKSVFEAERVYLETTLECVKAHEDFDVLAHLTYISKARAHHAPRPVPYEEHKTVVDEILRQLARKGKGMEMNTSGVDRCGDFLPYAAYFRRFHELGGRIVTVGSDAHTADRVGQYTHRACEILKEIFGCVCTFQGREPVFHNL